MMKIKSFTHVISAKTLADEIARLVTILHTNDYSTHGMDFTDLIARKLSDEYAHNLSDQCVRIKNHSWERKPDGSLRIKLFLPYEEDISLRSNVIKTS